MSRRLPVPTAPGPLESYASSFDDLFNKRNQRDTFRLCPICSVNSEAT